MVFIHPVIMRDALTANHYTRQKYSKLKHAQDVSNIIKRGILSEKAKRFPTDIKRDLVKNLSATEKRQIIIREQKQRELEYNNRIQQEKMAQQKRAAALQARRNGAVIPKASSPVRQIPQRLQNVMPVKRNNLPLNQ
jgi:hypothetical protein